MALGGLCLVFAPPTALILSVIGLMRGQDRAAAIVGLVLSGVSLLFFFGFPLLLVLCR